MAEKNEMSTDKADDVQSWMGRVSERRDSWAQPPPATPRAYSSPPEPADRVSEEARQAASRRMSAATTTSLDSELSSLAGYQSNSEDEIEPPVDRGPNTLGAANISSEFSSHPRYQSDTTESLSSDEETQYVPDNESEVPPDHSRTTSISRQSASRLSQLPMLSPRKSHPAIPLPLASHINTSPAYATKFHPASPHILLPSSPSSPPPTLQSLWHTLHTTPTSLHFIDRLEGTCKGIYIIFEPTREGAVAARECWMRGLSGRGQLENAQEWSWEGRTVRGLPSLASRDQVIPTIEDNSGDEEYDSQATISEPDPDSDSDIPEPEIPDSQSTSATPVPQTRKRKRERTSQRTTSPSKRPNTRSHPEQPVLNPRRVFNADGRRRRFVTRGFEPKMPFWCRDPRPPRRWWDGDEEGEE